MPYNSQCTGGIYSWDLLFKLDGKCLDGITVGHGRVDSWLGIDVPMKAALTPCIACTILPGLYYQPLQLPAPASMHAGAVGSCSGAEEDKMQVIFPHLTSANYCS